ncbi:ComF family protein [Thalassobacillus hwangdonensis]|uniref:ComF family protein n=2 Tax=Thalassobacillus hwangdonensis TaxID=546108 RepID=A0ABW3L3E9_9BACI
MQELIAKWKYRGDYMLVHAFEEMWKARTMAHFSQQECIYVPIPLSEERLQERGFNQAEALARFLPSPPRNLLSRAHSEKQSKKKRQERITSANPFSLNEKVSKPVVLVDDIYTTGITLRHAAKLLKENGCPKVYSLSLIRS